MAVLSALTIEVDTSAVRRVLAEARRILAAEIRALPTVAAADEIRWADMTDLLACADRLDREADD